MAFEIFNFWQCSLFYLFNRSMSYYLRYITVILFVLAAFISFRKWKRIPAGRNKKSGLIPKYFALLVLLILNVSVVTGFFY